MIIVQKETTPIADECILLGRQCENEARQVQFDLSWLIGEYGSGTATLVHQRNKDTAPYICTATQTGNTLTWTLDNQDTAYDGWGKAELRWTVGDVLAKTLIYKTMVIRSITADTTIPEPLESWYDQMIEYIDEHGGGGGGTTDYSNLTNKPQINGNTLTGNKTAAQLGLAASSDIPSVPVQSVNNKTGNVVLNASDVGAGTYSKPSGGIPSSDMASAVQTSLGKADSAYQKPSGGIPATDLSSAVQTSLGKADSALQSAPVSSVNSKTGAVTLAAGDIGYDGTETYTSGTVGKEISDLKGGLNDKLDAPETAGTSGQVLTSDGQGGQSWQTPSGGGAVASVNGQTGTVVLDADDVSAIASPSSPTSGQFLKWNGSAWVASDLPVYSGGVS